MKRAFLFLVGLSAAALSSAGCGGEPFTATGGTGGSTAPSGGTGGDGGAGGDTMPAGGTGGDTTSMGGTGGAGGVGGGPVCQPLSEPCTQCAFDACPDLYCACYANADCPALVNCVSPCDPADIACVQPCLTAHKDSISTAFLLADCAAAPCDGTCPGLSTQQPCPRCLFENCSTQMNECLADPDCYEIVDCAVQCPPGDIFCAVGCAQGKPAEATNKALAVQACTTDPMICQAACGG